MDASTHISAWGAVVNGFNAGELVTMGEMLAEHCTFNSSGGPVGASKAEILAAMQQGRDSGWVSHTLLEIHGGGEFITSIYRNAYLDGSSFIGAGVLRLDDDGKVIEIRSLEPLDAFPAAPGE